MFAFETSVTFNQAKRPNTPADLNLQRDRCENQNGLLNFKLYKEVKFHPVTGHECPQRKKKYSSRRSLTSALDGMSNRRHTPTAFTPHPEEKTRYSLYRTLGGLQGRSGMENLVPTRIRSADRPARV